MELSQFYLQLVFGAESGEFGDFGFGWVCYRVFSVWEVEVLADFE